MTLKECYATLGLKEGADPADIKRAYRRLAFALHPDLNPAIADAARRFQLLNEAYVILSQHAPHKKKSAPGPDGGGASARTREEARKAYSKAGTGKEAPDPSAARTGNENSQESVLRDILNDPFARRVFEDIYSHIREEGRKNSSRSGAAEENAVDSRPGRESSAQAGQRTRTGGFENTEEAGPEAVEAGVVGKLKGWLRRQIDDEQVLRLPGASLVPGARVRLEIQHGLSGEPQVIELTLPPGFKPGKPMRLKGMGKRIGNWKGDLYVRIEPV